MLETIRGLRGSWADITTRAEEEFGPVGRTVALLLRCEGMGSKALISSQIEEAGYDVSEVLEWAQQPCSSEGLRSAAAMLAQVKGGAG